MPAPLNMKLFDLQNRFKVYYDQFLGSRFTQLEAKRKKYRLLFAGRVLIWLMLDIALCTDIILQQKLLFLIILPIAGIISQLFNQKYSNSTDRWELAVVAIGWILYFLFMPQNLNIDSKQTSDLFGDILSGYLILHMHILAPFHKYKTDTKNMVQQKIIDFFGNFKYEHKHTLPAQLLQTSRLFYDFDKQYGDDYFSGSYQNVNITVSEEKLTYGRGRNKRTVFKGIIIQLDMNKSFSGQTVVHKSSVFNIFRSHKSLLVDKTMQKVELEDLYFHNMFDVYSTNQVEARYILTTSFMEKLICLKKMYNGKKVELSFFNDSVIIAIKTSKDMFETTSLFYTTARYGKMSAVVRQFFYIFEIIELLQLNKKVLL